MLFKGEDSRLAREAGEGPGKQEVGDTPPISGSWAPPPSGLGDTVPSTSGWFHYLPPPRPQAHLDLWILTNLLLPHPQQHL